MLDLKTQFMSILVPIKLLGKNRLNVDLGRLGDTSPWYEGLYSKKAISLFR